MVWQAIEAATRQPFQVQSERGLDGGCINEAFVIEDGADRDARQYFVKCNRAELLPMFAAESAGLTELLASNSVRAPRPICSGSTQNNSFLVLECIEFGPT